jgi:hypothetical protein
MCVNSLKLLWEDLQHTDRDLKEANSNTNVLQNMFEQYPVIVPDAIQLTTFYDSDISDQSASADSGDSIASTPTAN